MGWARHRDRKVTPMQVRGKAYCRLWAAHLCMLPKRSLCREPFPAAAGDRVSICGPEHLLQPPAPNARPHASLIHEYITTSSDMCMPVHENEAVFRLGGQWGPIDAMKKLHHA